MAHLPRLSGTGGIALFLLGVIFLLSPAQLPVILLKLALLTVAAFAGYWIDRELFPYARPHEFLGCDHAEPWLFVFSMLRRAIIIAAAIAGVALGL